MHIQITNDNIPKLNKIMNKFNKSANSIINEIIAGIEDVDYKFIVSIQIKEKYEPTEIKEKNKVKLRLK